jgi:hypothetical protein
LVISRPPSNTICHAGSTPIPPSRPTTRAIGPIEICYRPPFAFVGSRTSISATTPARINPSGHKCRKDGCITTSVVAPRIAKMPVGISAHSLRPSWLGSKKTNKKVAQNQNSSDPAKTPGDSSDSSGGMAARVNTTPPGITAHQRSRLVRYASQKAKETPPKYSEPP